MKAIDLRSDTVTTPTEEMRRAIYDASLGDDVYGEDPSVNSLEELAARMLGKEAALLTVSGTMSNLLATLTHTNPGDEIILGSQSHIFWYEVGGASALGGAVLRTVPNGESGEIALDDIEGAIRGKNVHFPRSALLCLENTHNRCGGAVLTPEYTAAATALAHGHGLKVHLDGARIFNAAIALGVPARQLARDADSVCFCLSKGLSAPVGSVLCGTQEFTDNARKWRKMVGGGMRQAGIIAAAGVVALRTMIDRLQEDHDNARRLAHGLANIPGLVVRPADVATNIVMFECSRDIPGAELTRRLAERGVKIGSRDANRFRAVTHRLIDEDEVDEALSRIEQCVREIRP